MDRFMVRLSLGYPAPEAELDLLQRKQGGSMLDKVNCVADRHELAAIREKADSVFVDKKILDYAIRLSTASRNNKSLLHGASPRATIAVINMAKAAAWVRGRDYVIPDDVKYVYPATITHRLVLTAEARAAGRTAEGVLDGILATAPAPAIR